MVLITRLERKLQVFLQPICCTNQLRNKFSIFIIRICPNPVTLCIYFTMKTKVLTLSLVFVAFILFVNLYSVKDDALSVSSTLEYFKDNRLRTYEDTLPDELKDSKYGESEYSQTLGDIKVSLATVNSEKHYIKYSWASYDLSNFTIKLFAEDINMQTLDTNTFVSGVLQYGNTVESAFFSEIVDFPEDAPLGYKQTVILYFYPLNTSPKTVDITLYYADKVFVLKDVNIVI